MFGKLMKYELRYLIRIFGPMWAIVVSLCVLTRLTLKPDLDGMMYVEGTEAIAPAVIVMLTIFAIVTMMIVATVVLIQRFYKGMYGDEGYLMFTLPVTTGSLIHSKAFSSFVIMVITVFATYIGIMIMVSYPQIWNEIGFSFKDLFQMFLDMNQLSALEFTLLAIWLLLAGLLSMLQEIYLIYLAISIGQLWKKHPVAGGIIAYYVIMMIITGAIGGLGMTKLGAIPEAFAADMSYGAAMAGTLILTTLYSLIMIVITFLGTKLILDKKLNIA